MFPARDSINLTQPLKGTIPENPADYEHALAWFTAEHSVLLATVAHAAAAGFHTHTWQLAWSLNTYLVRRGHLQDNLTTQHAAVAAAKWLADPLDQADAHRLVARAHVHLGRYDEAYAHLRDALDLTVQADDKVGQARTHLGLGLLRERQDRYADALDHAQQALDLFRAANHRPGQAHALNSVGWHHAQLSNYQQTLHYCQQALDLNRELGDRNGQAASWDSLGYAHHHLDHYAQAITCYQHALDLSRKIGNRYYEADTLTHLGDTQNAAGRPQAARATWQQALAIFDQLDQPKADQLRAKLASDDH